MGNAEEQPTPSILPILPQNWQFLQIIGAREKLKDLKLNKIRESCHLRPRIRARFTMLPFPHNQYFSAQQDEMLAAMKLKSIQRREGYPHSEQLFIREKPIATILDKDYCKEGTLEIRHGKVVLPLASVKDKQIRPQEYLELLIARSRQSEPTKISIQKIRPVKENEISSIANMAPEQKPVKIYTKKKNPSKLQRK